MADFDLPDLTATLRLDTSELDKAVGKAAGVGAGIGSALGNVAGGALDTAIGKVTDFATGSVDAFAELEDATAAAGQLFGDQASVIADAAEGAASRVGISQQQYIDAAATFGTFGKAAGLQGPELAKFADNLTGLAGDMASFKGTTPEQAIEAVGAALRGESEPIRAYGVLLDEATIKQEANRLGLVKSVVDQNKVATSKAQLMRAQENLTKVLKDDDATAGQRAAAQAAVATAQTKVKDALAGTTPELTKQQKLMATQSAILNQTKVAQGDFARTADSTANTQKRLAAESANAQAALGAKLAPALTFLRVQLLAVVTSLTSVFGWFSRNRDILVPLAAGLAVATLAINASAIATRVAAGATRAWAIVQGVLNAVMTANPIGIVVAAIALLVAGIVIAYRRSATFRAIVQSAFAGIRAAVTASMAVVRAVVSAVVGFVQSRFSSGMAGIRAIVSAVMSFVRSHFSSQLAAIRAIVSSVLGAVAALFRGDFGKAKEYAVAALRGLLAFVRTLPSLIRSALGNLGGLLAGVGSQIVQGLVNGIRGAAGRVSAAAAELASHIPGPIKKLLGIASPSKVTTLLGDQTGEGLEVGVLGRVPGVAAAAADLAAAAVPTLPGAGARTGVSSRSAGGSTLVDLSPASLAALARAVTPAVQVLLDSAPIAATVNRRLGAEAAGYDRTGAY